jgi:hypothetical protein
VFIGWLLGCTSLNASVAGKAYPSVEDIEAGAGGVYNNMLVHEIIKMQADFKITISNWVLMLNKNY